MSIGAVLAPVSEGDRMTDNFDVNESTVLLIVPPRPRRVPPRSSALRTLKKPLNVFARPDIQDRHRQKFFSRITIVLDCRCIDIQEIKRLEIVYPRR